jgi:phage terminase large subunit-like protein
MFLVQGPWIPAFQTEVSEFPNGLNDDQVDGVSGVYGLIKSARTPVLV